MLLLVYAKWCHRIQGFAELGGALLCSGRGTALLTEPLLLCFLNVRVYRNLPDSVWQALVLWVTPVLQILSEYFPQCTNCTPGHDFIVITTFSTTVGP